jgi:AcrR family transcriptional regulator
MTASNTKTKLPARQRILNTAHDLFYRDGIRATGIDRIIAESGVTKVTLYRHFPSKNELIKAYLQHRHEMLIDHLRAQLRPPRNTAASFRKTLISTLREWFDSDGYRGCAFINAVTEMQGVLPEVAEISKHHKDEVQKLITAALPPAQNSDEIALAISVAMDGAILRAQMEKSSKHALDALKTVLMVMMKE